MGRLLLGISTIVDNLATDDETGRKKMSMDKYSSKDPNKDLLLHRIAKLLIKLTYKYHKEDRDVVGELYDNSLAINQVIGQEMEGIRIRERGGKP